ncbi:hypothetical protein ACWEOE_41005 [Amycolatopsis sp. NPDC004368]
MSTCDSYEAVHPQLRALAQAVRRVDVQDRGTDVPAGQRAGGVRFGTALRVPRLVEQRVGVIAPGLDVEDVGPNDFCNDFDVSQANWHTGSREK